MEHVLNRAAVAAGRLAGWLRSSARTVPGVGGAACIVVGLAEIYHPLGWVAAGAFLLVLDNRTP